MEWVGQLYDIENQARELSAEARLLLGQKQSIPVLDRIENYLAELAPRALPKGTLAKAVGDAQNQWQALRRFTEDDLLAIDNNLAERMLRNQAIGRKNWSAPDVPSRISGRCKARDALLAMFDETMAV